MKLQIYHLEIIELSSHEGRASNEKCRVNRPAVCLCAGRIPSQITCLSGSLYNYRSRCRIFKLYPTMNPKILFRYIMIGGV